MLAYVLVEVLQYALAVLVDVHVGDFAQFASAYVGHRPLLVVQFAIWFQDVEIHGSANEAIHEVLLHFKHLVLVSDGEIDGHGERIIHLLKPLYRVEFPRSAVDEHGEEVRFRLLVHHMV